MRLTTTQPTSPYVRYQHTTNPDSAAGHSCIHLVRRDTFHSGAINTIKQASSLCDKEAFSCPKFIVLDVGRVYPQGWPHNLFCVDIPHVHSADLSSQRMVFSVQQGTKTMTNVNTTTTPATGNTSPLERQQAIENALSTALYFIRLPSTESGLRAATSRAIRAASLLKQTCAEAQLGGAA